MAKSEIFLPEASACFNHLGCRPRPDQVSPVAALRYFGGHFGAGALRRCRLGGQIGQGQTMLGHQGTHLGHGTGAFGALRFGDLLLDGGLLGQ